MRALSLPMTHTDSDHLRQFMDERCARHQFEAGIDRCRECGHAFCGECLVYSFGERQPPFCIPCALAASGVRSNAARTPALPKKEIKRRQKETARLARESAARTEAAAAATTTHIDWSLPVNGSDPNQDPDFPLFEDDGSGSVRPQPPTTPRERGGLAGRFGRRKNKVVPF